MREIDLDNLKATDLVEYSVIAEAFKKYLMNTFDYEESEADFVTTTDFANPYNTPFIAQDYEGIFEVDGIEYEVRYCKTDFAMVGLFHLMSEPQFEFYMLFDKNTLPDNTVGSYQNARKMFIV